jgi:aminopeptidase N
LCQYRCEQADEACAQFKKKWSENTVVMDHYYQDQIRSKYHHDIVGLAHQLETDGYFDITNPNKIRSLFRVFGRNLTQFHKLVESVPSEAKGDDCAHEMRAPGYDYMASKILEIDPENSEMASELALAFDQYGKLDSQRKGLMKTALDRILAGGPSDAVLEVVNNILK